MDLNSIRAALRAEPLGPFGFCLEDGRRIPVKHPEFVAMTPRVVVVLDEDGYLRTLEPLLIVSIEPSAGAARGA